jgi:serine/threonine-protein kinase
MARAFPDGLRAELDRLERLRRTDHALLDAPSPPEETQVIALRPDEPPGGPAASPPAAAASSGAPMPRRSELRRATLAGGVMAAIVLVASIVLAATSTDASSLPVAAGGPAAPGRLLVQPRAAATLVVDGEPRLPSFAADEVRTVALAPGRHRVELRTEDGHRTGATIEIVAGQTATLLGVDLE